MEDFELKDDLISLWPNRRIQAAAVYAAVIESMPELSRWMPWAQPGYSVGDSQNWLKMSAECWRDETAYEFAIIDNRDGSYIGGAGLNHLDRLNKVANLGYWIRSSRCKQGIATRAARLLVRFGLDTLKFNRIEILAAVENRGSQRVAEKTGAVREGILRNQLSLPDGIHDAVIFSIIPSDSR
jgi:ribosomal-protein-serine acetyltransferase